MFIVTNTCDGPFKQCFCVCTDSGPSAREGYDLNLTDLGDQYLVEAGSEKGRGPGREDGPGQGRARFAEEARRGVDNSISPFDAIADDNKAWISRVMNRVTTGFIDERGLGIHRQPVLRVRGLLVRLPHLLLLQHRRRQHRAPGRTDRMRTWDSCSYEGYTRMAGDHNPRKPVEDRRNKRFFCKLSYSQSKKYLRPGCVGCGRCVRVCPGDIGLPNVVTYIRREITKAGG